MRRLIFLPLILSLSCGTSERRTDPLFNTFSIVCRDATSGDFGVAVTTMPRQVRKYCPYARAGVGAVSTQAMTNTQYGPDGLDLMEKGKSPAQAIQEVTKDDDQRAQRQVGMIAKEGKPFSYTGKSCMKWCGHLLGKNFAIQGNLLVSEKTLQEAARAFSKTKGSLAWRMLQGLKAGKAAGGDKRGHRSAALIVASKRSGDDDYLIDIHVDDDPEPVKKLIEKFLAECSEWFELGDREFGEGDTGGDVKLLEQLLKKAKVFTKEPDSTFDEETASALKAWQKKKGAKQTGKVDKATLKKLLKK